MKFDLIAQDGPMRNILGDNPVLWSVNQNKICILLLFPFIFHRYFKFKEKRKIGKDEIYRSRS